MSTKRKIYTAEFKIQAVKMVTELGQSYSEVAKKLGLSEGMLYRWKKQLDLSPRQPFSGSGKRKTSLVDDELTRLQEQVQLLTAENDLLKKATAFFARQLK